MIRGDIAAVPAPVIHVDWRIVFDTPAEGKDLLWKVADAMGSSWLLSKLLVRKTSGCRWLETLDTAVAELIVVGGIPLQDALRSRLESDRVWARGVTRYETVGDWRQDCGAIPRLAEIVLAPGSDGPWTDRLRVRVWTGIRHRIGVD